VVADGEEKSLLAPLPKVYASFSYSKPGEVVRWRSIVLLEEDDEHVKGRDVDTGEFRCFLKSRILGGCNGIFRSKEGE